MMNHFLSHGGGVDTTALHIILTELVEKGKYPAYEAVHVKHYGDAPETYENIQRQIDSGFPITVIEPDVKGFKDIYKYFFNQKIVPMRTQRSCTHRFKIIPMRKYYKSKGEPYTVYIGFDADEAHRIKEPNWKHVKQRYPLIEMGITRKKAKKIILNAGLPIPPKSGCYICPFTSKEGWQILKRDNPDLFEKACLLEENSPKMKLRDPTRKVKSLRDLDPAPQTLIDLFGGCRYCEVGISPIPIKEV